MAGQGYRHAGDIEIQCLKLISAGNQLIDLGELVVQLDIFQSLMDPFMRCELLLNDGSGILSTIAGGFTGGEMLAVSYKSNDDSLPLKSHLFVLHEVSGRMKKSDDIEVYLLNGSSVELYQDAGYKVSRSFGSGGGELISDMVKKVISSYLYNENAKKLYAVGSNAGVSVEKTIEVDPTVGNQKYIAPMIEPTQLISRLSREADNDNQNPYYFFYEDSYGYKFKDLTTLISSEPIGQYVYQPKNFAEDTDWYKINSYSVNRQNSFYNNVTSGMLKNRNIQLDIMRRQWNVKDTNYQEVSGGFPKLQDVRAPGIVGEDSNPALFITTSRIGHDMDSRFSGEQHLPRKQPDFVGNKLSLQNHITNVELEVEIPGDSQIDVGKTVILRIPTSSGNEDQKGADDFTLSGKYLITRVRHKSTGETGGKYQTIIRCVKESGIHSTSYVSSKAGGQELASQAAKEATVGLDAFGGAGEAVNKVASDLGGIVKKYDAFGDEIKDVTQAAKEAAVGLDAFGGVGEALNKNVAAVTGKVGGAVNKALSKVTNEAKQIAINKGLGDAGLDSIVKEAETAISSVEGILKDGGDISKLANKIQAKLPEVSGIIAELDKFAGHLDTKKIFNLKDAQSILDVATGEFKKEVITLANGKSFQIKEIEDNLGKVSRVLVKTIEKELADPVNVKFISNLAADASKFFKDPVKDFLKLSDEVAAGKYGEGSIITMLDTFKDKIQKETIYTVVRNPLTKKFALVDKNNEAQVAAYKKAGFNL